MAADRMSRWRRRLTGGMLAGVALVLLVPQVARAEPGAPVPSGGGLSEADRNFLIKVRLVGSWPELSRADRDFLIKVRLAGLGA